MHKELNNYIKSYSFAPNKVNRLIVSNFLYTNRLEETQNKILLSYLIKKSDDKEFKILEGFLSLKKLKTIDDLISLFEFVISPQDKIVTGAIFTPAHIRNYIINETLKKSELDLTIKICDPACGCAGFLYSAAKEIKKRTSLNYKQILENQIFGLDIQEYSVERSKILLNLLAISEGNDYEEIKLNIFSGNALNYEWGESISNFNGFDIIVGNPPYVCSRNIDSESFELLKNWSTCSTGHPDLYIPFFELGLHFLKDNGILGYITVNSFYKSVNGRALRSFFQENQYDFRVIDFGDIQIFKSKNTYTCICLIQKKKGKLHYTKVNSEKQLKSKTIAYNSINYTDLEWEKGWNLQNSTVINKIESIGTSLGEKYKTRNGIATLKNNIYVFKPIDEDDDFFYLQNGQVYPIERGICTEIINPNKLTKLTSIDSIRQQAILPYTRENNNIELFDEVEFQRDFPNAYHYLSEKREILALRDKGKGKYENWFAYGRNQSLEMYEYKMFFPHIAPDIPNFVINEEEELLFYNGLALIGESERELLFMKKIMSSRLFWFYITNSSKPYGSGYFSLSRNYIKNFGIYNFSENEIDMIINEDNQGVINEFIESKYNIELS